MPPTPRPLNTGIQAPRQGIQQSVRTPQLPAAQPGAADAAEAADISQAIQGLISGSAQIAGQVQQLSEEQERAAERDQRFAFARRASEAKATLPERIEKGKVQIREGEDIPDTVRRLQEEELAGVEDETARRTYIERTTDSYLRTLLKHREKQRLERARSELNDAATALGDAEGPEDALSFLDDMKAEAKDSDIGNEELTKNHVMPGLARLAERGKLASLQKLKGEVAPKYREAVRDLEERAKKNLAEAVHERVQNEPETDRRVAILEKNLELLGRETTSEIAVDTIRNDVHVGDGAFATTPEEAAKQAKSLQERDIITEEDATSLTLEMKRLKAQQNKRADGLERIRAAENDDQGGPVALTGEEDFLARHQQLNTVDDAGFPVRPIETIRLATRHQGHLPETTAKQVANILSRTPEDEADSERFQKAAIFAAAAAQTNTASQITDHLDKDGNSRFGRIETLVSSNDLPAFTARGPNQSFARAISDQASEIASATSNRGASIDDLSKDEVQAEANVLNAQSTFERIVSRAVNQESIVERTPGTDAEDVTPLTPTLLGSLTARLSETSIQFTDREAVYGPNIEQRVKEEYKKALDREMGDGTPLPAAREKASKEAAKFFSNASVIPWNDSLYVERNGNVTLTHEGAERLEQVAVQQFNAINGHDLKSATDKLGEDGDSLVPPDADVTTLHHRSLGKGESLTETQFLENFRPVWVGGQKTRPDANNAPVHGAWAFIPEDAGPHEKDERLKIKNRTTGETRDFLVANSPQMSTLTQKLLEAQARAKEDASTAGLGYAEAAQKIDVTDEN